MANTNMVVLGSSTNYNVLQISGTDFKNMQSASLVILCGVSGNAVIPVRVDTTGAIENTV